MGRGARVQDGGGGKWDGRVGGPAAWGVRDHRVSSCPGSARNHLGWADYVPMRGTDREAGIVRPHGKATEPLGWPSRDRNGGHTHNSSGTG